MPRYIAVKIEIKNSDGSVISESWAVYDNDNDCIVNDSYGEERSVKQKADKLNNELMENEKKIITDNINNSTPDERFDI